MNYFKSPILCSFGISVLLLLSGCSTVINWVRQEVPQSCQIKTEILECPDIQTLTLYDQFTLLGEFDVLWVSNKIKRLFVDMRAEHLSFSESKKSILLKNELEENKHFATFYILSLFTIPLASRSEWNITLSVDGEKYTLIELLPVELPYEYQYLFAYRYNNFKQAYKARFSMMRDSQSVDIQSAGQEMVMTFHKLDTSVSKKDHGFITWKLQM